MRLGFWLKALSSAAILTIVFVRADLGAVGRALSSVDPAWFLAGASMSIPLGITNAQRWRTVSLTFGEALPLSRALVYTWIGQFINLGLPTLLGLDSVRAWKLHQQGIAIGRAARIVIVDRLFSLFMLLILLVLGMPHLLSLDGGDVFKMSAIAALVLGVLGLAVLSALRLAERLIPLHGPAGQLYELSRDFDRMLFGNKALAARAILWSIANHLCRVAMVFCLATALGVALSPSDAFVLVPPALLIAMIPITLGGWGVREMVFIQAFSLAGVAPSLALAVSLLYGLVGLAIGLFGGGIWLAEGKLHKVATTKTSDITS